MNKNYKRGYDAERRAVMDLRAKGYIACRSAGSHGIFDVWAFNHNKLILIQIKREKHPTAFEKYFLIAKEISKVRAPRCSEKWLWVWHDKQGWKKYRIKGKELIIM